MAQHKIKVKAKLPDNAKHKSKNAKQSAFQRKKNAPIKSKKHKFEEAHKIKQAITKALNKKNEEELKSRAISTGQKFSLAQQAVAKHHQKIEDAASTSKINVD